MPVTPNEISAWIESIERDEEQGRRLRTFSSYARAWALAIDESISPGPNGRPDVSKAMKTIPSYGALQQRGHTLSEIDEIRRHFLRGRITLAMMQLLPTDQDAAIAAPAMMWIPVQAYYAVHGAGLAALTAFSDASPKTHRAFCHAVSSMVGKRFPEPLNTKCIADPNNVRKTVLPTGPADVATATDESALSNVDTSNATVLVAKSILTTRKEFVELERLKATSKLSSNRKRLSSGELDGCWDKYRELTAVDFLYRLRIRSNYGDPEALMIAPLWETTASRYCSDLTFLAQCLVAGFEEITKILIGESEFQKFEAEFRRIKELLPNN